MSDPSAVILKLAEKSSEISALSNEDLADLCKEVLDCFRSRASEWSVEDDWIIKELELRGLLPKSWSNKIGEMPPHAEDMTSLIKYTMLVVNNSFLETCIRSLERRPDGRRNDVPDLLKTSRTTSRVQSEGIKQAFSAYGPTKHIACPGHEFELWTESATEGKSERKEFVNKQKKSTTVVLGAGNESNLTLIDTLQRCIIHRETVLIKHHPLRPYLLTPYGIILEPLIRRGYVAQVLDEGIPETTKLLSNPLVGHVHVTGSLQTEQAIINTLSRTRTHQSELEIRDAVTSELGCVTPWILSPGVYDEKELKNVARMIVSAKKNFGGAACLCAQVLIIPKEWNQKNQFREALVAELKRQPGFPCYYPGSKERKKKMEEMYDSTQGRSITVEAPLISGPGKSEEDQVVMLECGTPDEPGYNSVGLKTEAFGPILALVELSSSGSSEKAFIENVAAPFVNNKTNIYGSLSCSVIVPTSSKQDKFTLETSLASLEYGTVAVNTWTAMGYFAMLKGCIWGGSPHDKTGQSGTGYVGNQYGLAKPVKTVVYGPPLTTNPFFDLGTPAPRIVLDALWTMSTAPSIFVGIVQILHLFLFRIFKTLLARTRNLFSSGVPIRED